MGLLDWTLDENDLDGSLESLTRTLYELEDSGEMHEDKINSVERLMDRWAVKNIECDGFREESVHYNALSDDEKAAYQDMVDWSVSESGQSIFSWAFETFTDEDKIKFLRRFQLTIKTCLATKTFDDDVLSQEVDLAQRLEDAEG